MHGMGRNRAGGRGADAVLKVPVGTQVFDEESGAMLADMTEPGERVVVAQGGNGGFGNAPFHHLDQPRPASRQSRSAPASSARWFCGSS